MTADAYPLAWPDGWPRYPAAQIQPVGRGNFMRGRWDTGGRRPWTLPEARDELLAELARFGASDVVVSSNFPPGRGGQMFGAKRAPDDQAIAVYFMRRRKPYVMACDEWKDAESNLRSLALAIDALRQLERHGGGRMLERAFTGFMALPAPKKPHEILGVAADASPQDIRSAWRAKIADAHPDKSGTHAAAAEINAARDAMLRKLEGAS